MVFKEIKLLLLKGGVCGAIAYFSIAALCELVFLTITRNPFLDALVILAIILCGAAALVSVVGVIVAGIAIIIDFE